MTLPPMMPRHLIWRLHYRQNRYLRALSQPELNARVRDIFRNLLVLKESGKVGLVEISEETRHWPEVWTHVVEEMALRHGRFPAGFTPDILHSEPFPDYVGELGARAAAALGKRRADTNVLVKFGQRKFMKALLDQGALRIQPASFFSSRDHNGAIRDDELRLGWSGVLTRDDVTRIVRNPQDVVRDAPDQRVDIEFRAPTDYRIYCVSASVQPRLFIDFAADACVIIRDPTAFTERIERATAEVLRDCDFTSSKAVYIDPLRPLRRMSSLIFVPLAKHFRYSYQKEYRFVWMPRSRVDNLTHVDVQIGPLYDIADLIAL